MAARKNKITHDDKTKYRFYVYEITDANGDVIYVGKGTGRRVHVSKRAVGGDGCRIVALFKRERDAYAYEVVRISEASPALNKLAGGNGPRCKVVKRNKSKDEKEIESIGTRAYAARYLLQKLKTINALRSKVDYPKSLLDAVAHMNTSKLYEVAYG